MGHLAMPRGSLLGYQRGHVPQIKLEAMSDFFFQQKRGKRSIQGSWPHCLAAPSASVVRQDRKCSPLDHLETKVAKETQRQSSPLKWSQATPEQPIDTLKAPL